MFIAKDNNTREIIAYGDLWDCIEAVKTNYNINTFNIVAPKGEKAIIIGMATAIAEIYEIEDCPHIQNGICKIHSDETVQQPCIESPC